jgi:methylmalonyl-CoA/ethylmalonyl-CoA epimerase
MNEEIFKHAVLDHVAIAVKNFDQQEKVYKALGFKPGHKEIVESQGVETYFFHVDTHAHIELLKPVKEDSPIQKFIDKKGEGIHHLSFKVEDILLTSKKVLDDGMNLIYEKPQNGANNTLVNFIHPKSTGGVLIEISQEQN